MRPGHDLFLKMSKVCDDTRCDKSIMLAPRRWGHYQGTRFNQRRGVSDGRAVPQLSAPRVPQLRDGTQKRTHTDTLQLPVAMSSCV